jgi:hypothetical protein
VDVASLTLAREMDADATDLAALGAMLDSRPAALAGGSVLEFLAELLLRVRARDGRLVPLRANRAQRAFEERRGRENIVLKARQMGMSSWVAARFFLRTITRPGTLTVQVAHTRAAAEAMFRVVHRFWENLPEPMRHGALRCRRANAGQLVFAELDSELRVVSAGDVNAGRGLTIQNLHCSEVARWPENAAATLAGLRAALVPEGECVLESTANGAWGCFWEEWLRAEQAGMVRHFFPWWMEAAYIGRPAVEPLNAEERRLVEEHGLTAEQIGFRRAATASYRELTAQEFAEDAVGCFRQSGECAFDAGAIERRMKELAGVEVESYRGGEVLRWYPPMKGKQYVVAVDPAGGTQDGDFAVAEVIELQTGLQCAELRGRLVPLDVAKDAAQLARDYNNALMVVERNNQGAAVLAYLTTVVKYFRLYAQDGEAGWLTSAATRPLMIARLGALLVERAEMFMSERLLGECRSFVRTRAGRSEAAAGEHDDCVMAMAMAQAARAEVLENIRR